MASLATSRMDAYSRASSSDQAGRTREAINYSIIPPRAGGNAAPRRTTSRNGINRLGARLGRGLGGAIAGAQLLHNLAGGLARNIELVRFERNRAHARVSAAAVTLADLGQVHHGIGARPGIGADRDLGAEAALAQTHAVGAGGMQVIGDELVVALQVLVGDVEEERAFLALGALP